MKQLNFYDSPFTTQSVLKCESEIEKDIISYQFERKAYNTLLFNNIISNYQFGDIDLYQSWNPFLSTLFIEQDISSLKIMVEISDEDFYIKPSPIKTYKLSAKVLSKSKGVPKINPID